MVAVGAGAEQASTGFDSLERAGGGDMYRVTYMVRNRRGIWESAVATFDYISESTAAAKLAKRHGVSEHDIKVKEVDEYNSMSELNDLLRG
jgi:hypothetical protein